MKDIHFFRTFFSLTTIGFSCTLYKAIAIKEEAFVIAMLVCFIVVGGAAALYCLTHKQI